MKRLVFLSVLLASAVKGFAPPARSSVRRGPLKISLEDEWADLAQVLTRSSKDIGQDLEDIVTIVKQVSAIEWTRLLAPGPGIEQMSKVLDSIAVAYMKQPLWAEIALVVVPLWVMFWTAVLVLSMPEEGFRNGYEPYPRGRYDPIQAKAYYSRHPVLVLKRGLQLARISKWYIINYFLDKYVFRDEERKRAKRAQELLNIINQAGPTAIKVGQALSVRSDLVPQEYVETLSTLQDRVPPFPGDEAKALLLSEMGPEKFSKLSSIKFEKGPVASASIGQVYKGIIGGKEVAIKCQRPNALSEIALDLYLVRELAPIYQKLVRSATDFQALANEWGRGFVAELDYRKEAKNTILFNRDMQARNINAVMAPIVVEDFSSERVLVTEWVNGVRIDQSDAGDIPKLCGIALNAYLVMLLETQSLHCDPHPGNILRTEDGRLCILDFGMTLKTDPDLQYSLLEFIAHLTGEDYENLPEDLMKLGFVRAERLQDVRASGILEPLTYFLKQIGKGGGADKVRERIISEAREKYPGLSDDDLRSRMREDMKKQMLEAKKKSSAVTGITTEVKDLQRRNRDSFTIPEWFVYTSRAFLTLEGVSLQADENYSLVKNCFPYVAKRLLADDSPKAQKALRDLLYGAGEYLDAKRLTDLADGFARYTTTTKVVDGLGHKAGDIVAVNSEKVNGSGASQPQPSLSDAEAAVALAKDSADVLLAPGGNLVQNLLVEEGALATSADVKDLLTLFADGPQKLRDSLPLGTFLPKLPLEDSVRPFLKKTEAEMKAQSLVKNVSTVIPQPTISNPLLLGSVQSDALEDTARTTSLSTLRVPNIEPEQAAYYAKEFRESAPKYAPLIGRLGTKFASTLLKIASKNIEATLMELDEMERNSEDEIVKRAARGFSRLAASGADAISDKNDGKNS